MAKPNNELTERWLARAVCIAATGLVLLSGVGEAQTLHGTVRDSANRRPIPGAVVTLLGAGGSVIGRSITNEGGAYTMPVSNSVQRMRIQRIGFRSREVSVATTSAAAAEFDIAMESLPAFLEPMRVSASACPQRSDRGSSIALLEQARSGLLTIVVARDTKAANVVRLAYRKAMDGNSDRIRRMSVQIDSADRTAAPFQAALSGRDFAQRGFVSGEGSDKTYFGPDPDVVLDDDFVAAYCFRVLESDRKRPNQVGLGFSPADRKRDRIDIDGVLWIDTVARALRDIEFRYVGFDHAVDVLHPGGRVSFREMPNGAVFIDRWNLRLVGAEEDTIVGDGRREPTIRQWLYAQESGGELARAEWSQGGTWTASLGMLRVHAVTHAGLPASSPTHVSPK